MKPALVLVLAVACGGPSQQQLAETPSASTRARPANAPPASTSDRDRERMTQSFDDMETTQRAYREAGQEQNAPPPAAKNAQQPAKPAKKGPAVQAPPEPKKKGPAEQAPPE